VLGREHFSPPVPLLSLATSRRTEWSALFSISQLISGFKCTSETGLSPSPESSQKRPVSRSRPKQPVVTPLSFSDPFFSMMWTSLWYMRNCHGTVVRPPSLLISLWLFYRPFSRCPDASVRDPHDFPSPLFFSFAPFGRVQTVTVTGTWRSTSSFTALWTFPFPSFSV